MLPNVPTAPTSAMSPFGASGQSSTVSPWTAPNPAAAAYQLQAPTVVPTTLPPPTPVITPAPSMSRPASYQLPAVPTPTNGWSTVAPTSSPAAPSAPTNGWSTVAPTSSPAVTSAPAGPAGAGMKDLTPSGLIDILPPTAGTEPPPEGGVMQEMAGIFRPNGGFKMGFYADAEFLLVRVRSDNLDYAIPNGTGGLATTGSINSVEYHLTPGIHMEVGCLLTPAWDVTFGYTYVHSDGSSSTNAGPGETIFPTTTRPGLTDTVFNASAQATLNYNVYDILVGRRFNLEDHTSLRVYGGIRFADIEQSLNAQYNGGDALAAMVGSSSEFTGVGPVIGTELTFGGWHGLNLYARASGGLIGGLSSNPLLETNGGGSTVYTDVNYNIQKTVPVSSIGLGGGWQYRMLTLRFGYEMTQWWGLTERVRFTDDIAQGPFTSRSGNLSLEGLFVQLALQF